MKAVSSEISLKQEEYDNLIKLYEEKIQNLSAAGEYYDLRYGEVKERYKAMEEAGFIYETQDAIRRWASTAYLDSDLQKEELLYAREKLERSQAVLDVLVNLFDSGETRRPYKNEEYEILFNEYEENFSMKMLAQKAYDLIETTLSKEAEKNRMDYAAYKNRLNAMSGFITIDSSYVSPQDKGLWNIIDLICVKDGKLRFSYDSSLVFHGSKNMSRLEDYFAVDDINGVETSYVSSFELAVRELSERLFSYNLSMAKYQQLGLARDYLLRTLMLTNTGIPVLSSLYHDAVNLIGPNTNLGRLILKDSFFSSDLLVHDYAAPYLYNIIHTQKLAWDTLSETEKEDLDFIRS
jgi:hypothetical protein